MPVISSEQDPEELRLVVVSEFDAPVARVWELWADARKLERWWGPPGFPATFVRHDFAVPGRSRYYMTSPEGERNHARWDFIAIAAPSSLEVENGFADAGGERVTDFVATNRFVVAIEPAGSGSRMTVDTVFQSTAHMEQMLGLGMEEGFLAALGQIDGILAAD